MSMMNKKIQQGFTLIELVIVIAILGILAAVALPKFFDLNKDAEIGVARGIAGAIGSASATNYIIRTGNSTRGQAIASCASATLLLEQMPAGYGVSGPSIGTATSAQCTVTGPNNAPSLATFTLHGV